VNYKVDRLKIFVSVVIGLAFDWGVQAISRELSRDQKFTKWVELDTDPRLVKDPARRLESLVVEVNGERRIVYPRVGLDLVRGDLLTIVDAYLVDKSRVVRRVDLIGYRSRIGENSEDDLGRVIDTGRSLSKRRSRDSRGDEYRIEAYSDEGLSGSTILRLRDPELLSFEIEINGVLRKMSGNEPLRIRSTDKVRVVDIRTNVRGNENITYDRLSSGQSREIRFSRSGRVFARIPVKWLGQ
jgi:hypothetical protein